jgi:hypothetical protein
MSLLGLNQELQDWRKETLAEGCGEDYISYALIKTITSFLSDEDIKKFYQELKK